MVTHYVEKITITCSQMLRHIFDTIIVVLEWFHEFAQSILSAAKRGKVSSKTTTMYNITQENWPIP